MTDVLGVEPRPLRRRAVVLWVLALGLAATGAAAERWQSARERATLVRAVTAAEEVVGRSAALREGLREHQAALANVTDDRPVLSPADERTLAQDAQRWLPRLAAVRDDVATVTVLPWHGELRAARTAQDVRLARWSAFLARTRSDPQAALRPPDDVRASHDEAARALRAVHPRAAHGTR